MIERYLILGISTITLSIFVANAYVRREKITRRTRRIMLWFQLLLVYVVYGNALMIAHDYEPTPATHIGVLALIGLCGSFLWHPEGDDRFPPDDESIGQKVINLLKGDRNG